MTDQAGGYPRQRLEGYARKRLAAERHPQAAHRFRPYACPECEGVAFRLRLEHHSGAGRANFRGVIWGRCTQCGAANELFRFSGPHRQQERETVPRCACGGERFYVGECERVEGSDGLPGFVDEGVAVAACVDCGRLVTLAQWD